MDLEKLSSCMIVFMLVCTGFGMIASDNAQAAFIEPLSNTGLPSTFVAYDTAWNEAGTMAVVVGYDSDASPGTNAYAYYPNNDTYWPIDNNGYNDQSLHAVDYFSQPIYDWPNVLLVDADYNENDLIGAYENIFAGCKAYTDVWEVWASGSEVDGKPTSADMASYDLVVWIPSRDMVGFPGARDAFNYADQAEVMNYLNGGGNFFLANNYFFNDYNNMLGFCGNYLGIGSMYSFYSSHGYNVRPIPGDSVFGDLPTMSQNWNGYGWGGSVTGVDIFRGNPGTICLESDDGTSYYEDTGIRYDSGTFKTMFFSNPPLETLYVEDATLLMQTALDWLCPAPNLGLDQSNENMGGSQFIEVGNGMYTDNPWAQAFIPDDNWISSVEFFMYQSSDMGETFEITVYNDNGGHPDYMGPVLAQGTLYSSEIPVSETNAAWVKCPMAGGGASLTPGITYWIVCYRPNFWGNVYWLMDNLLSYTDGDAMDYNGALWNMLSFDFLFRTYSEIPLGIIDQSNEDKGNTVERDVCGDSQWAQSFVPSASTVEAVEFYMYRSELGRPDYFTVEICTDSAGQPGSGIEYGYIYQSDIPFGAGNAGWVRCELFNPASVTAGNPYWIVVTISDATYGQYWFIDQTMSYTQGEAWRYTGGMWTYESYYDWIFREYSSLSGGGVEGDATASLYPSKDNTLYSDDFIGSNGIGKYVVCGQDWGSPKYTRGLIEFDISSSIPRYSTITGVRLEMYCDYEYNGAFNTVSLGFVTEDWGEGGSDAPDPEDFSALAQIGDATWDYSIYDSDYWGSNGGSFSHVSASSGAKSGSWTTWNGNGMVEDVQAWADDPGTNRGWLLIGDEGMTDSMKFFCSKDHPDSMYWPRLIVTYSEPTPVGYEDVFWIAGDLTGAPPTNVYQYRPQEGNSLIEFDRPSLSPDFQAIAVDGDGNPLCAGQACDYAFYHDGNGWMQISSGEFDTCIINTIAFNHNDGRFYLAGYSTLEMVPVFYYTDSTPLTGTNSAHRYAAPGLTIDVHIQSLAWNELYDYGLAGGEEGLFLKVWPYGHWGNGTMRYLNMSTAFSDNYIDISWDTDGWNEAGIVGYSSSYAAYWRYYNSNPQLLSGSTSPVFGLQYYTCAFKPPSSPKWLFIPSGAGSIRVNTEEKDQSHEITVNVNFPHIFTVDMWKQSNPAQDSVLETQIEADSTYTIFVEGNYTRDGLDRWDTDLTVYIQGWYDGNQIGFLSNPPDTGWSEIMYRTWQFNISYFPATETALMNYPLNPGMATPEFYIHSVWEDPNNYGADSSYHRFYVNVTFGRQTAAAPGDGTWNTGNSWDRNSLNDRQTWDLKVLFSDSGSAESSNASYAEFGVRRYAAISVGGSPSGSIPPGGTEVLGSPSYITYSSNMPYQLNVSIPDLHRNGNPLEPNPIPATSVSVMNAHPNAISYSDIEGWRAFEAANNAWCIWGLEPGTYINPPGHGTVIAGPFYSDYSAAAVPETFQATPVYWQVSVPPSTAEGVYRGTITITIWS